jgi:ABC-type glycerol-3-phosphate transport system permease component
VTAADAPRVPRATDAPGATGATGHAGTTSAVNAAARTRARRGRQVRRGILVTVLVIGGLVMMLPFFWMIMTSLKTRAEVFGSSPLSLPTGPHFENYATMWNALPDVTFGTFFLNSLKLASLNTIGQLISCSMAAFAFSALRFRFREPLFGLLLVTLIIPFQVVLVPNFILYRFLPHPSSASGNWIGTQEPLWVGAFLGGAFGTFLLRQFFLAIPRELADAARVDGANPWQIYRHVYIPLSKPVLATLAIFTSCGPGTT